MLEEYLYNKQKEILAAIEKCKSHFNTKDKEVELIVLGMIVNKEWFTDWEILIDKLYKTKTDNIFVISYSMATQNPLAKFEFWQPIFLSYLDLVSGCKLVFNPSDGKVDGECHRIFRDFDIRRIEHIDKILSKDKNADLASYKEFQNISNIVLELDKMSCDIVRIYNNGARFIYNYLLFNEYTIQQSKLIDNINAGSFHILFKKRGIDVVNKEHDSLVNSIENILYQNTGKLSFESSVSDWKKVFEYILENLKLFGSGDYDSVIAQFPQLTARSYKCIEMYSNYIIHNMNPNSLFYFENGGICSELWFKPSLIYYIDEYFFTVFRINYVITQLHPKLKKEFENYYGIKISICQTTSETPVAAEKETPKKKSGRPAIPLSNCFVCDDKDKQIDELKKYMVEALDAPSVAKYLYELKGKGILSKIPSYNALHDAGLAFSKTAWQRASKNAEPIKRPEKR